MSPTSRVVVDTNVLSYVMERSILGLPLWHRVPLATHDEDFEGIAGLEIITIRTHPCVNDSIVGERTAPRQIMQLSC